MRDLVFLPVELIKDANEEGWLRSASYFVRMKSLHWNNTHYNFSLRSLSSKLGCSPACLSHHIEVLKQKGLVRLHSGNMCFLGLKKMRVVYGYKTIGVPVDCKNQLSSLRCQIIRFNLCSQQFKIKKSELHIRRKGGILPTKKSAKASVNYPGLSAKGSGSLFGLSISSGSRIRRKLSDLGFIKCERVYSILFKNKSIAEYRNLRNNLVIPFYSFLSNGSIVVERQPYMEHIPYVKLLP